MQPGAPGGWGPQGGQPGYGQQAPAPGGYQQAPAPGGYQQAPAPGGYQQPQQPMAGPGGAFAPPGGGMSAEALKKGFVGAMFDFSFNNYVTPKIVKVLYGIWLLMAGLVLIGGILSGFYQFIDKYGSAVAGLFQIVVAPFAAILIMILGRVYMEVLIVLFKIAENLGDINRKTKE